MEKCRIYHTGVFQMEEGFIKDNKVYLLGEDDKLFYPEEMFLAREECENQLIQFEVKGKWGFANIETGKIIIEPVWDYAGPFYRGYSHVVLDAEDVKDDRSYIEITGGKHGYIDTKGSVVIPLEYHDALDIPYKKHFQVKKSQEWGLIDNENKVLIPFKWHYLETNCSDNLIFSAMKESCEFNKKLDKKIKNKKGSQSVGLYAHKLKWAVYDSDFNLIIEAELDEEPFRPMIKTSSSSMNCFFYEGHFVLKKDNKFGLIAKDGRLVANVEDTKEEVGIILNQVSGREEKDLYI